MRRRLELRAASARGDLTAVRSRIRDLFDTGPFAQYEYVEYADARAYADQARQAVSAIGALTGSGRVADAITLAREAMRLLAEAVESVDDSDGWLGQISADLADAHLGACRTARPDRAGSATVQSMKSESQRTAQGRHRVRRCGWARR